MEEKFKVGDNVRIKNNTGGLQFPSVILALFLNRNGVEFAVCENDSLYNEGELKVIRTGKLTLNRYAFYKNAKELRTEDREKAVLEYYSDSSLHGCNCNRGSW